MYITPQTHRAPADEILGKSTCIWEGQGWLIPTTDTHLPVVALKKQHSNNMLMLRSFTKILLRRKIKA